MIKVFCLRESTGVYPRSPVSYALLSLDLRFDLIRSLFRAGKLHKLYRFKDLELDGENRVLRWGGETIVLPPMEFDVLMVLMKNKNRTVSRQQILSEIWGYEYFGDLRTVDVRIANLRKKLNLAEEIRTIPRTGYRLEEL